MAFRLVTPKWLWQECWENWPATDPTPYYPLARREDIPPMRLHESSSRQLLRPLRMWKNTPREYELRGCATRVSGPLLTGSKQADQSHQELLRSTRRAIRTVVQPETKLLHGTG